MTSPLRRTLVTLWRSDRFLTAAGLVLLAALVPMLVGLAVDPRTITGAPAWLKPAKFAVSTGVYGLTLAWILGRLSSWPRVRWIASRTTGVVFIVEVAIISAQAWRGTASHFNLATPLDAALFQVMGGAIVLQTLAAVLVAVALWRQRFEDRALGWALRFGVTIAIAGAATGGLMTRTIEAQLAETRAGRPLAVAGAHTVGAPDGGPGLPATGWSLEHGDLRAPHFIGLHAMQALPLVAWALGRRRAPETRRARALVAVAVSYTGVFGILLWQALRGQSIVQPDAITLLAFAAWAVATALALRIVWRPRGAATPQPPQWVSA